MYLWRPKICRIVLSARGIEQHFLLSIIPIPNAVSSALRASTSLDPRYRGGNRNPRKRLGSIQSDIVRQSEGHVIPPAILCDPSISYTSSVSQATPTIARAETHTDQRPYHSIPDSYTSSYCRQLASWARAYSYSAWRRSPPEG